MHGDLPYEECCRVLNLVTASVVVMSVWNSQYYCQGQLNNENIFVWYFPDADICTFLNGYITPVYDCCL